MATEPCSDSPQAHNEVALVISDLGSGGAQRVLVHLADAWARDGRRVAVITESEADSDFFVLNPSVQRICVGGIGETSGVWAKLKANIARIRDLRRALAASGAPILVSFICPMNVKVILASLWLGRRVIVSERNDPARQSLGRSWDFLRWSLYRVADVVTANSHGALETLKRYVPSRKLAYVPNLLVVPPPEGHEQPEAPTIVAVGRLHYQKAYDVLLDAFAQLSDRARGWRLICMGEGPLREELGAQTERLGIAECVIWQGRVSDPFLFYRCAEFYVLPSRHEGTPNAMLEAMGCSLPVIVTDASPGPLVYVEHGISGLVVPVDDPPALAAAMERLMTDPDLRRRLGAAGRRRVEPLHPENALPVWESVIGL